MAVTNKFQRLRGGPCKIFFNKAKKWQSMEGVWAEMEKVFNAQLDGKLYSCCVCGTHLALADDLISKVYLFSLSIDITSFPAFPAGILEVCVCVCVCARARVCIFGFNLIFQLISFVVRVILMPLLNFVRIIVKNSRLFVWLIWGDIGSLWRCIDYIMIKEKA